MICTISKLLALLLTSAILLCTTACKIDPKLQPASDPGPEFQLEQANNVETEEYNVYAAVIQSEFLDAKHIIVRQPTVTLNIKDSFQLYWTKHPHVSGNVTVDLNNFILDDFKTKTSNTTTWKTSTDTTLTYQGPPWQTCPRCYQLKANTFY